MASIVHDFSSVMAIMSMAGGNADLHPGFQEALPSAEQEADHTPATRSSRRPVAVFALVREQPAHRPNLPLPSAPERTTAGNLRDAARRNGDMLPRWSCANKARPVAPWSEFR